MRFSWRLPVLVAVLVLAIGAVASAGLTQLSLDRQVQAQVVADNANAAVKLECLDNSANGGPNYSSVCDYANSGVVTLKLEKGIASSGTIGFNNDAYFKIGDGAANKRVLKITNNSPLAVKVWLEDANSIIKMYNQDAQIVGSQANAQVINPGASHEFYFEVDSQTNPVSSPSTLTATLKVQSQ